MIEATGDYRHCGGECTYAMARVQGTTFREVRFDENVFLQPLMS